MKIVRILGALALVAAVGATTSVVRGAGAATTGVASALTPITPCRLIDTRPGADHVGDQASLGPGAVAPIAVAGTHGNCNIPDNATGISANVTITNPTAPGYLTLYPSGGARPVASNINWVAGQAPTANFVVVGLAGGKLDIFNFAGTVDVVLDINGYYSALPTGTAGPAGAASTWGQVTGFLTKPTLAAASSNVASVYASSSPTNYGAAANAYCVVFGTPIGADRLQAATVGGFAGASAPVATVNGANCKTGELGIVLFNPLGTALGTSQNGSFTFAVP